MRVWVRKINDKCLEFHIMDSYSSFKTNHQQIFDVTNTKVNSLRDWSIDRNLLSRIKMGKELYSLIPMGFHKLLIKNKDRLRNEALILILEKPLLADFPWEYVPVAGSKENAERVQVIAETWQSLPLVRSIPWSSPGDRNALNHEPARRAFFTNGIHPKPKNFLNDAEERLLILQQPQEAKDTFLELFNDYDFLHIACHAHVGQFSLTDNQQSGFLNLAEIDVQTVIPRVVDADCCHIAEAGAETDEWDNTMPGRFIKEKGAAVFCGNLGKAQYIGDAANAKTFFSEYFVQFFREYGSIDSTLDKHLSFVKIVFMTRECQSKFDDPNNSQVIYVADNWNIRNCNRDILLTKSPLEKIKYPGHLPLLVILLGLLSLELLVAQLILPLRTWLNFGHHAENILLGISGFVSAIIIWIGFHLKYARYYQKVRQTAAIKPLSPEP